MIELFEGLGHAAWTGFWLPTVVWTMVSGAAWVVLGGARGLHPLAGYRARQALLLALPVSIVAVPLLPALPGTGGVLVGTWVDPSAIVGAHFGGAPTPSGPDLAALASGIGILIVAGLFAAQVAELVRQLRSLGHLRAVVVPVRAEGPNRALQELKGRLGVGRRVTLLEGPPGSVPMTFHWWRPSIVMPASLLDSGERLRIALAHELIHIRRSDYAWALGERLLAAPFSFHPLVRGLRTAIDGMREASCDAEVVGAGVTRPRAYAELLFDIHAGAPTVMPAAAAGMVSRTSHLRQRLETMKRFVNTPPSTRLRSGTVWFSLSLFAATVALGACAGHPQHGDPAPDVAAELTSRFGPMPDETRDAALERLDVQMAYLSERIEAVVADLGAAQEAGEEVAKHRYEQYDLLTGMYLERLETFETLKLERETELRLGAH